MCRVCVFLCSARNRTILQICIYGSLPRSWSLCRPTTVLEQTRNGVRTVRRAAATRHSLAPATSITLPRGTTWRGERCAVPGASSYSPLEISGALPSPAVNCLYEYCCFCQSASRRSFRNYPPAVHVLYSCLWRAQYRACVPHVCTSYNAHSLMCSPGEELLLDYGKQYWVGREGMQLP